MAGITQKKNEEAIFPLQPLLKNEKEKLQCRTVLIQDEKAIERRLTN